MKKFHIDSNDKREVLEITKNDFRVDSELLRKKTIEAFQEFDKKIFFLGHDQENFDYWLEENTWCCGWYWGFGYIKTYTNNANPKSRDINKNFQFNNLIFGNDSKTINDVLKTPFSYSEALELSDLLKSFYTLQKTSAICFRGHSDYTSNPVLNFQNPELYRHINSELMPQIFKRVYEILTPEGEEVLSIEKLKLRAEA